MPGTVTCTPLPDQGGFRVFVDWNATLDPDALLLVERIVAGQPPVPVRAAYAPTESILTGGNLIYDFRDSFTRVVANGWGTPDVGPPWTVFGTAANYSVDGTRGVHSVPAAGLTLNGELPISLSDVDAVVDMQSSVTPTGGGIEFRVQARFVDDFNFVDVRVFPNTGGTATFSVRQLDAGVETFLGFPTIPGVSANSNIRVRIRAIGDQLSGKAWNVTDAEPATWNLVMNGLTHLDAGALRMATGVAGTVSNPFPLLTRWDNLKIGTGLTEPQRTVAFHITNCGQLMLWDFEAPMDTPVSYRVTDYPNGDTVTSTPCVLASDNTTWLKDPLRPCHNIKLAPCRTECPAPDAVVWVGYEQEQYGSASAQFEIVGRRRPIDISLPRKDATTTLHFATLTCAARDQLLALTAPGTPIFIPAFDDVCWPDRYVALGDHAVIPLSRDLRRTERLHTMPAVVVDPPAGPVCCVSGTTWCEMCACADTWDEFDALALTGIDVLEGEATAC